jgi:hypothetical protein
MHRDLILLDRLLQRSTCVTMTSLAQTLQWTEAAVQLLLDVLISKRRVACVSPIVRGQPCVYVAQRNRVSYDE